MAGTKRNTSSFSLKRLFASITLFAVACAIISQMIAGQALTRLMLYSWVAASLTAGAGIVVLWGFNRRTAWLGVIFSWALVLLLLNAYYTGRSRPKATPSAVAVPAGGVEASE
jgi:O-antigen/teichoic acid export membrane protein